MTKKIVFSGDLGNVDQPLPDATLIDTADYVAMESTYATAWYRSSAGLRRGSLRSLLQRAFDRAAAA